MMFLRSNVQIYGFTSLTTYHLFFSFSWSLTLILLSLLRNASYTLGQWTNISRSTQMPGLQAQLAALESDNAELQEGQTRMLQTINSARINPRSSDFHPSSSSSRIQSTTFHQHSQLTSANDTSDFFLPPTLPPPAAQLGLGASKWAN
ncbi:hypothetical protein BJ508DRAFT_56322 [Ascobolus immersus RN42]|uniref:Uncharacterized protein n=1 Tax=Ascobolus immersus RN42 TaxID=1160509 RepID=A0A3N4IC41_ASCIM|nr:hypothetical protein BJ508DRAFT_56322 [Ascobolus immersus RN42]